MSHGDSVEKLPPGFESVSKTVTGVYASMVNDDLKIVALQFHPEVTHTENGIQFIRRIPFRRGWYYSELEHELGCRAAARQNSGAGRS